MNIEFLEVIRKYMRIVEYLRLDLYKDIYRDYCMEYLRLDLFKDLYRDYCMGLLREYLGASHGDYYG
jgi:hypothetical protein